MKKILLILALLVSTITFSQDKKIVQAYAMNIADWNDDRKGWDFRDKESSDVSIEIVKNYLFFDNKINTVIITEGEAREGDGYYAWDAVDDKGKYCSLMMYVDEEPYSIVIMYDTFCVTYYVTYD